MKHSIHSLSQLPPFEQLSQTLDKFSNFNRLPTPDELSRVLSVGGITFVAQSAKSADFFDGYEQRIFLKGEVQTRENSWHDFFNALVWHQFPHTKKAINQWQYQLQLSRQGTKQRTSAENMLTLFDENGCIVLSRNADLLDLIRQHRWHELFWRQRESVERDLKVIVFGHGIFEKSLTPYVGLTAKCLLFIEKDSTPIDFVVDDFLNQRGADLRTTDLFPLPLLGVPGWWPDNNDENFYANAKYFRP